MNKTERDKVARYLVESEAMHRLTNRQKMDLTTIKRELVELDPKLQNSLNKWDIFYADTKVLINLAKTVGKF